MPITAAERMRDGDLKRNGFKNVEIKDIGPGNQHGITRVRVTIPHPEADERSPRKVGALLLNLAINAVRERNHELGKRYAPYRVVATYRRAGDTHVIVFSGEDARSNLEKKIGAAYNWFRRVFRGA